MTTSAPVRAGELDPLGRAPGTGPDVLLIAGTSDLAEAWQPQLGLAAFDNRGSGRTALPDGPLSTPPACCGHSASPALTWPASPWVARSRRHWLVNAFARLDLLQRAMVSF